MPARAWRWPQHFTNRFRAAENIALAAKNRCKHCGHEVSAEAELEAGACAACGQALASVSRSAVGAAAAQSQPSDSSELADLHAEASESFSGTIGDAYALLSDVAELLASDTGEQVWHMRSHGVEYGPVSKSELDRWVDEERLDQTCQVRRDGFEWTPAGKVYPLLGRVASHKDTLADPWRDERAAVAAAAASARETQAAPPRSRRRSPQTLFANLLDFSFAHFSNSRYHGTARLLRIFYALATVTYILASVIVVSICLWMITQSLGEQAYFEVGTWFGLLLASPTIFLPGLILARLFCELAVIVLRNADTLRELGEAMGLPNSVDRL